MKAFILLHSFAFSLPIFNNIPELGYRFTISDTRMESSKTNRTFVPNTKFPKKITLLHTNDIHSHFEEFNLGGTPCYSWDIEKNRCFGGVARIKTVIDKFRSTSKELILLDAGDQFQGTLFFNTYGGELSAKIMNQFKYDAFSIGNHDFDRGIDYLATFIRNLTFPVLGSNLDVSTLRDAGLKPYTILEKYNIGIIGFITKNTASISSREDVRNTTFLDPVGPVQKYVDELHSKGIRRIICLSHNGYAQDQELAKKTRGIHLIVGGHSHTLLMSTNQIQFNAAGPYPTKVRNLDGENTFIVQAHRYGDYLGHLELEWDYHDQLASISGEPVMLDYTIPKNKALDTQVKEWAKNFDEYTKQFIAYSTAEFPYNCKMGECAMGDLITDCMLEESRGVDVAFINSGSMRASFGKVINLSDVMTVFPFGNSLVTFKWSGERLLQVLERASAMESKEGVPVISHPQWSGLKFTVNMKKPKFERVSEVKIGGKDIKLDAYYNIITFDFVAKGGDNLIDPVKDIIIGEIDVDMLSRCLKRKHSISPIVDNRVNVIL